MNNSRIFADGKPGLFLAKQTFIPVAVVSILTSNPCLAQITPDTTLGNQNSQVTTGVNIQRNEVDLQADLIEGGVQRGSNLYHSFLEFNVNNGQRVYFANPTGVENIFSRVTGINPSNILGTLGVNGAANLFLLNPKGIIFGPNAKLDIQGSFLATTANSFKFSDGSEFSATSPQAPSLLTMSVPVGVQFGSQPAADITSKGELVAEKDLTLNAGNLDLQGTVKAGRNLTLQAQNNLKVRDIESNAFIAPAGGNLLAQGDLSSSNYSVIHAIGDVSFNSYTGGSLHILAGGSVNIAGNVTIKGVDSTGNSLQETVTRSDGETEIDIDGSQTPTLDIRAGVDSKYIGTPNFTSNTPTNANININGNLTNYGGLIFLTNQYQPNPQLSGNIATKEIYSGGKNISNLENGGNIVIESKGNITASKIYSGVENNKGDAGNAGNIIVQATGNIRVGATDPNSPDGEGAMNASVFTCNSSVQGCSGKRDAGNAGSIKLTSTNGGIKVIGGLFTNSTAFGEGSRAGDTGNITLQARNGTVEVIANGSGAIVTRTQNDNKPGTSGNAGNITIDAKSITIKGRANNQTDLDVTSESKLTGSSGKITFNSQMPLELNNLTIGTDARDGKGGNIDIIAPSLTINKSQITTTTSGTGNAGYIKIIAQNSVLVDNESAINTNNTGSGFAGNITIDAKEQVALDSSKISSEGNNGWIIIGGSYQPKSMIIDNSKITTDSKNLGDAGNITINASDKISIDNGSEISSQGNNGSIVIGNDSVPKTFTIDNYSKITTDDDNSEQAGNITINASEKISIDNGSKISSTGNYGSIVIGNDYVPKTFTIDNNSKITTDGDNSEQAGNITINASDKISIDNGSKISSTGNYGSIVIGNDSVPKTFTIDNKSKITTDGNNSEKAGDITINASDKISIDNGSEISSQGNNGSINITTGKLSVNQKSEINTNGNNSEKAGNITINASEKLSILNNSNISSKGKFGNVNITTGSLYLNQNSGINTNNDSGDAGDIKITTQNLLLRRQSKITTTAGSEKNPGNGGSIKITAEDGFVIAVPSEDSDITANAFKGQGGKIDIRANRILGFKKQENLSSTQLSGLTKNGISDISASSDVGDNGEVSLNTLSIDPTQGLVQLPTNIVDTSRLIAQGCGSSSNVAKGKSEFVITGRGGLPPSPDDTLKAGAISPEWVVNNTTTNRNNSGSMPERNLKQLSSNTADTLVEAVGMVRNANGDIVFTAQPTTATGLQSGLSSQACGVVQGNVKP
ncbi:two-partner secretion domain-containing protein [Anabaena azotica]|uniref:two-partner secretion domain-containing protein n=1 Tax=Anabaena azotica TaxID=197653 RepID=UPI0018F02927|nr:filamentous hemagglutinin N-terminal domain-containing protein [Anabaena azotica]